MVFYEVLQEFDVLRYKWFLSHFLSFDVINGYCLSGLLVNMSKKNLLWLNDNLNYCKNLEIQQEKP